MSNSARKRVNQAAREGRLTQHARPSSFLTDIHDLLGFNQPVERVRIKPAPVSKVQSFAYDGTSVMRFEVPPEVGPEYAVLIVGPSGEIACQLEKWATFFTADMKDIMGYNFPAGNYTVAIVYTPS